MGSGDPWDEGTRASAREMPVSDAAEEKGSSFVLDDIPRSMGTIGASSCQVPK